MLVLFVLLSIWEWYYSKYWIDPLKLGTENLPKYSLYLKLIYISVNMYIGSY